MADDLGEKTEDPTPRRREQARDEGNVAKSQDLAGALTLVVAIALLAVLLWPSLDQFKQMMEAVLADGTVGEAIDRESTLELVEYVCVRAARIATPLLLIMFLVAALAHFVQVGWLFSPKVLIPKISTLNPMNGFKRIFGLQGLVKVSMDIVKVTVVVVVGALTVFQYRSQIVVLAYLSPMQAVAKSGWMVLDLSLRLAALLLLLGLLDLMFQRWKHKQDLKMTKQQVKDEMKQSEGDPEMKARRFRMQQQIAMQRISAAVPKADVIVTNPEHISVAIRYDADRMHAPTVIAKGADFLALRIRQIALLRNVPIVERPPLARALYAQVAVGQEVPPEFYHAVAEILAYVYGVNRRAG